MGYLAARLGKLQPTEAEREQLILSLREAICQRSSPCSIIIFGSVLSQTFTHASDLDCAVIFPDRAGLDRARKTLHCHPPLVDHPYDLLLYEQAEFFRKANEGGICQVIQETGRRVYDQISKI